MSQLIKCSVCKEHCHETDPKTGRCQKHQNEPSKEKPSKGKTA